MTAMPQAGRTIGLVLGAGAARGWAHIGVLRGLGELGLRPDVVCGCSSGALVGASYVTGRLDALAEHVGGLTFTQVMGRLDVSFAGGGLLEGRAIVDFFRQVIADVAIESVQPCFGAVATDLDTGREIWLTSGSIIDAVRASIALPGLMVPFRLRDRWLVDGALVDPVPVSLCRALGADVIVGVSLNGNLFSLPSERLAARTSAGANGGRSSWLRWPFADQPVRAQTSGGERVRRPTYFEVMTKSFFAVQDFVSRVRMAADPVDAIIAPRVSHIGLLDFHRGAEAIDAGYQAVAAAEGQLKALLRAGLHDK